MGLFIANKAFVYGGQEVVAGQMFDQRYLLNDAKLVAWGYATKADHDQKPDAHCDLCNRDFATQHFYSAHLGKMHGSVSELEPVAIKGQTPPTTKMEEELGPSGATVDPVSRTLSKGLRSA